MITSDKIDSEKKKVEKSKNPPLKAMLMDNPKAIKQAYLDIVGGNPNDSPNECFKLAIIYANEDDNEAALFDLKKALRSGYHDLDSIRNANAFADLRTTDNYKAIMHEFIS